MRTKSQIKLDRLISIFIGYLSLIVLGYSVAKANAVGMCISLLTMLILLRVDNCNNDLEYGRFALEEQDEVEE